MNPGFLPKNKEGSLSRGEKKTEGSIEKGQIAGEDLPHALTGIFVQKTDRQ